MLKSWKTARRLAAAAYLAAGFGRGHEPLRAEECVTKFLLWCILLVLCWPLALLALVLYPLVWLLLLPFRLVGIAVGGVLELLWAVITLPARLLGAGRHA
jgi:hypothetical protein